MRTSFAISLALLLVAAPIHAQEMSLNDFLEVAGLVRASASSPIENAVVIAFSLSDRFNLRTSSGAAGQFELPPLPVGVYRVVAVKRGFLPAFATVIPTKKDHRVTLELESQATASDARKEDAWTLRRSLPKDVLRQVENVLDMSANDPSADQDLARFAGSMESLAGYSGGTAERELERTSVAFRSDLGAWGLEFRGSRHLIEQEAALAGGSDLAEAADLEFEVRSSESNAYRVTSTRASWNQWASSSDAADVQTHTLAWHGHGSSVQVRYLRHENLFPSGLTEEDSLEVAGNAVVYRGRKADLGVSIRLKQDSFARVGRLDDDYDRYADLATTGRYAIGGGLGLEYGVATRIGDEMLQIMPQTAAKVRLGDNASLQLRGAYKFDTTPESLRQGGPGIAYIGQFPTIDTRYKYSVTLTSDVGDHAGVSASARRAAADALTFLLFDDRFDEFWDGLYLHRGEVLSDGVLSVRAGVGPSFEISMTAAAGSVDSPQSAVEKKQYFSSEIRTHYEPTGTTVDVSYRFLEQPDLVDEQLLREIERMSVVIGQSLHLPVDLRLLLGFSVANEGEALASVSESTRSQKRLMGGLSFSF